MSELSDPAGWPGCFLCWGVGFGSDWGGFGDTTGFCVAIVIVSRD